MEKRLFQILDEMNVGDINLNTKNVSVSNTLVSAYKAKKGGHVTIAVSDEALMNLLDNEDSVPLLIILNQKEYDRLNK